MENASSGYKILRKFQGTIEALSEDCIHAKIFDLTDNRTYNIGFNPREAKHEVGIGDRVVIRVYENPLGETKTNIQFSQRQPLNERDYQRIKKMFG